MSDEQVAAATVTSEQPQQGAAAVEQATTPNEGIRDVVDATPENADAVAKTDETKTAEPEGEEAERKRLSRTQRLARKNARLSTIVADQAAELETFRKSAAATQDAEPKEADFNGDYLAYQRALSKWDTKQLLKEALPKVAPEKRQPDVREIDRQEAGQEFLENAKQIKTSITDYDQTIEAFEKAGGKFAPHVIEELLEIGDKGPLLAYHLAKTPGLAAELNAMSPRDAAREIGRLEAKATLPERKTQTKAPAPLSAVKGGAAQTADIHTLAKSDSADAYIAARRAQRKASA